MDNSNLDLGRMSAELKEALVPYAQLFRPYISFGDFEPLRLTPEKNYTARTKVPVFYDQKPAGNLYALVFQFHDGTGDDNTFKPDDLIIPGRFEAMKDKRKIMPRSKENTCLEAFFPFFTAMDGKYFRHAVSLEELTVDNPEDPETIVTLGTLGLKVEKYSPALRGGTIKGYNDAPYNPPLFLTCGHQDNKRFGDPHAIFCSVPTAGAQVAGFLAVPENPNPAEAGLKLFLEREGRLPE
ncbi:hypothetical protein KY338_00155 [Candidatus Woesearchaeota archaeon]|nr:hypothetical protein [Candidatus Woesearchaeota archaeon]MBW3005266.1 hypothetical protein [Candidatus Woesearchaeota archaeon]